MVRFPIFAVVVAALIWFSTVPIFAQDQDVVSCQIVWKNRSLSLENPLLKQNGVILAPLRELMAYTGGELTYSRRDDTYTLVLKTKPQTMVIYPHSPNYTLNQVPRKFQTASTPVDGILYVPLAGFLTALGYEVRVMPDRIFVGAPEVAPKANTVTLTLDTALGALSVSDAVQKNGVWYGNLDSFFKTFNLPVLGLPVPIEKTLVSAGFWVKALGPKRFQVCSVIRLIGTGLSRSGLVGVQGWIPFKEVTSESLQNGKTRRFTLPYTHVLHSEVVDYGAGVLTQASLSAISPTASVLEVKSNGDTPLSELLSTGPRRGEICHYSVLTSLKETAQKNGYKISLKSKGPLSYRVYFFENPNRMVIDLPNMVTRLPNVLTPQNSAAPYRRIRTSQFQFQPAWTRVVIDMDDVATFGVSRKFDELSLIFAKESTPNRSLAKAKPKPKPKPLPLEGKLIVIDPGHGGDDPGAIGANGTYEKDYTLDISKRLERSLTEAGAHVMMCRLGDQNPSLEARTDMANVNHADVLLSVHINSFFTPFSSGSETYYYKYKDEPLAHLVHQEMVAALHLPDKGMKRARLYVLRNSTMPSVLVEPLFITNKQELLLLEQPYVRQKIADAVFQGTIKFFKK